MSQVFDLSSGAEFADVFLSGFGSDVKAFGDGEICATVEFGRMVAGRRRGRCAAAFDRTGNNLV